MVEEKLALEGLILLKPEIFSDDRGLFLETFNTQRFNDIVGENTAFFQDNISLSKCNVLRGLHFQKPPMAQGKIVQVLTGRVLDVVVDIRKNSPTYGQHYKKELSQENKFQLWIPPGFAHGFIALEDQTIFSYKCTNVYSKKDEMDLLWNDSRLNIDWGNDDPLLSEKDKMATPFNNFNSPFE